MVGNGLPQFQFCGAIRSLAPPALTQVQPPRPFRRSKRDLPEARAAGQKKLQKPFGEPRL